jgi:hypothetical protein
VVNWILSRLPTALAARSSVTSVTEGLAGSRRRSTAERLVAGCRRKEPNREDGLRAAGFAHVETAPELVRACEDAVERLDRTLGRLLLRTWADVAFFAALGSAAFGIVVLRDGQLPGVVLLLLAGLFVWLGLRAWRDRARLGEALNRDFAPGQAPRDRTNRRGTDT